MTYRLMNAKGMADAYPLTFEIPPSIDRNHLRPGMLVKLIFAPGERMWVVVKRHLGNRYIGTLSNDPVLNVGVAYGDEVTFGSEHIIDIER